MNATPRVSAARRTAWLAALALTGVLVAAPDRAEASHYRGASCSYALSDAGMLTVECYHLWRLGSENIPSFTLRSARGGGGTSYGSLTASPASTNIISSATTVAFGSYSVQFHTYTINMSSLATGAYYVWWTTCCRVSGIANASGSNSIELKVIYNGVGAGKGNKSPTMLPATIDIIGRGQPYNQNLNSVDPDRTPVSYEFRGGTRPCVNTSGTTVNPCGNSAPDYGPTSDIPGIAISNFGTISIANTAALTGNGYVYKVRVTDGSGAYTERDVLVLPQNTLQGTVTNAPPVLDAIGPKLVNVNSTLSFNVRGTDPNSGQTLTVRAQLLPPGSSFPQVSGPITGTSSTFTWTPGPGSDGVYYVNFEVYDNHATPLTDPELVQITVAGANNPPVLAAIGNKTVGNGSTLTFTISATDADGHAITYSAFNLPAGATFTPATRTFSWTPTSGQYNNTFTGITFRATDNGTPNLNDDETINITVGAGNAAPQIDALSNQTVNAGSNVSFTVRATDSNTGQIISLTPGSGGLPSGATMSPNPATATAPNAVTSTFSWTPSTPGSYVVNFQATDNGVPVLNSERSLLIVVNTPPVAVADSYSGAQDTNLAVAAPGVLSNDTGADAGQTLTAALATNPTKGIVTLNSNGSFSYTPNPGTRGVDTFTYRTSDGFATSGTATVTLNINGRPTANAQTVTTNEDTAVGVTLSGSDPEGSGLTYAVQSSPTRGTLSGTPPNLTYTPTANLSGADSFTFTVSDGSLTSAAATVTLNVTAINDAPVANNQSVTTNEDTPVNFTLTGSDVDSGTLTFAVVSGPTRGVVSLNANTGAATYTPNLNQTGADSFTFRVNDGALNSANATVSITINGVNDAPTANALTVGTNEDTAINFTLTGSDPEGTALTFALATGPARGAVSLNTSTGAVTYTPHANLNGADTFTFTVSDGALTSTAATVTINVAPVNDAPVANNQTVTTNEDTAVNFTLTGSDVDGNPLTFALVTAPTRGVVSLNANTGAATYTPNANLNGADSFTFRVNDGTVNSAANATVSITVNAINDTPIANAQTVTTNEDTALNITLTGSDVEGSSLTFAVASEPSRGTLALNTTTGAATYTPSANLNGADSFTFTVRDGALTSAPATVTVNVTAVNDTPVANAQTIATNEDTAVNFTLTGSDVEGSALTFALVAAPTKGAVSLNTNTGAGTYTPNANQNGTDSFTFTVRDGALTSAAATVTVNITAVNDAPTANAQSVTTNEDTAVAITLTGSDPEGTALTYTVLTSPTKGTLSGTAPALTYTPTANQNGADSFTFRVRDGALDSAAATVSINIVAVNDTPIANNLSVSTNEDTAVNFTLTGSDADANTLTFAIVTPPTKGAVSLNANTGAATFTPNANLNGADSFTFRVNDGTVSSASATVSITITAVNDAPVATGQTIGTNEDTPVNLTLAGTDIEGGTLTFALGTAPSRGSVSINAATGAATYTPTANQNGADSFTFTVSDGALTSAPATVNVNITAINDAPVANNLTVTTNEDTPINFTLTGSDVDGNPLTFTLVASPTRGALGLNSSTGAATYTPGANQNGADSFTFRVSDGTLNSANATVSITITPVNDTPVATPQSVTTPEDTPLAITLAGTDVEGTALSFTLVTTPTSGTLSGTPPAVTYTPNANFNGADSFTFRVSDGALTSAPANVNVSVTAVNDAPVANAQSVSTNEDTPRAITLTASDVEGSPLTYTVVAGPTKGTLSGSAPNLTYAPALNQIGADSFTFRVSDGALTSNTATVSITLVPVNDAPVAGAQSLSTNEDTPLNITFTGSDVDGDALTFTVATVPANGALTGTPPNVTYTPNANFNGSDSFTFRVSDGALNATATINLTVVAVNDAPVATSQAVTTAEDTAKAITLAGTDVEGSALTFTIVTGPSSGVLSGTPPLVTYTPNLNFNGADSFTFRVNDGTVNSVANATVNISVTAVNDPPVAGAQTVTTNEDTSRAITLTGSDVEGGALTYGIVTGPPNGSLSGTPPTVTYAPNANFNGTDSFVFRVTDPGGLTGQATVTVNVTAVNDAPVAQNGSATTNEDQSVNVSLGALDVEGSPLTYAVVTNPANGALSGSGSSRTYTPNLNFNGTDSFTFTASDGALTSNVATVNITVVAVNDAPVATPQSSTTAEDTAKLITLAGTDVEGSALSFAIVAGPASGTLSAVSGASVTYTPNPNFNGTDSFTFRANDGALDSAPATVSITVTPVNDTPIANAQSVVTDEDTPKTITLTGTDIETPAASLTFAIVGAPTKGTLSGAPPNLTYAPGLNQNGADSFTFTASDGLLTSTAATVNVTINAVNDAPVATPQSVTTDEDTPKLITLAGTDVEGSALTFAIVTGPSGGTLSAVSGATVTYTPNLNFNGSDSFTFRCNDGALNSLAATVSVTVAAVNDRPIANAQAVVTDEDTSKAITLTGTDIETAAASLTFAIVAAPTKGTLSGTPPNVTYTPGLNQNGSDSFTFTASDGQLTSTAATVNVTITAVNDAPVANSQSVTTNEDTPVSVTLTGSDVDSGTLTFTVGVSPTKGTLSGTPPNLTYSPGANQNGADSFTFTISDGALTSNTATVSLTITPVNDAPVANSQSVTTNEDTPLALALAGSDIEGTALSYTIVAGPIRGTLSGTAPNVTYAPTLNLNGADSFTFRVSDGLLDSNVATVNINVVAVNDAPIAYAQSATTPEDTPLALTLTGSDVDSGTLTYSIVTPPAQGALSGTPPSVTYAPNAHFNGSDSFTFRIFDGALYSTPVTVNLTITAVNDRPTADAQTLTATEDTDLPLVLTGADIDGDPLTFAIVTPPTKGDLLGSPPNLTYRPDFGLNGADSFTFTTNDGALTSVTATVSINIAAVNDVPVATPQTVTTPEDTPLPITLTGTDLENDPLVFALVTPPTRGTLSGTPPNVTYSPSANLNGDDTFTFVVSDGELTSTPALVRVQVTPVNDAPVANAQSVGTNEDTPVNVTLTGSDIDGNPLTYAIVTGPAHGTLSGTPPNVTYAPNLNYNGTDSFTFRANDGLVFSNTATVSLTITAVNDAPLANAQSVTTNEDTPVAIVLTGSDVDPDTLTFSIASPPTSGVLSGSPPNVTYSPSLNFNGTDAFTFRISDGVLSATAVVSLTVTAVNDVPIATPQSVTTAEDTPKAIVLAGTDVEGTPLAFAIDAAPAFGTLSGTPPNVTYSPSANYNGPDSFTFRVSDGQLTSVAATVSLSVTAVNDAPVALAQSVTTAEDTPKAITLTGTDIENTPLTFAVIAQPTKGTLSGSPPNLTYAPNLNYHGNDSFTFQASDGVATSNIATVSITVTPVNDTPVANAQGVTTSEDTPVAIVLTGSDLDGDTITFAIVDEPAHGTLTGAPPNVTYAPAFNYNGPDAFTFRVSDGQLQSALATVSVTVNPVNDPPVANPQSVTTAEDTPKAIALTGTDIENTPLTYAIVAAPTKGTLSGSPPNVTYSPNLNYHGTDSFTFQASDGVASSNIATVSITVTPVNDSPVAQAQTVQTNEDTPVNITLAGNDLDGDPITFSVATNPAKGVLTGTPPALTYTPHPNANGSDTFTFTVSDGALSHTATVTLNITPVNDAPTATSQTATTPEDTPLALTLAGTDIENTPLTFTIVTAPTKGALSGTPPNVTYTPNLNFHGTDGFTFRVSDGALQSGPASVSLTITPVNDRPVADAQSVVTLEGQAVAITLTGSDLDGDAITFAIATPPAKGTLSGTPPNVTYRPNAGASGSDSFTFTTSDGALTSTPATVGLSITGINDAPIAQSTTVTTAEDTPVAITLVATDAENDPLTFTIETPPQHGTLTGTPPNVTYTPRANFNGADGFSFVARDATLSSATATLRIQVAPVNDAPTVAALSAVTLEDTPVLIALVGADADGDALTFTVTTQPTKGTLTGTAPNLTYTPNAGISGTDSFTYRASDGSLSSATATVSVTITAVNDQPSSVSQSVTTPEDTPRTINLSGTDPDGDLLTYSIVTPPLHGALSGTAPILTYTPAGNFFGADSFTFRVSDGVVQSGTATVSITVTAVNDPPTATGRAVSTAEGTPVAIALVGTDPDGDALTFTVATPPTKGTLSGNAPNLTYSPTAGVSGTDSFTFLVADALAQSAPATVTIAINAVNDPPLATPQSVTTAEDTPKAIVLAGTDPEGDALTFTIVTPPSMGTLTGTPPNVTYTPNANVHGTDSFTFRVSDATLSSGPVAVAITITPVNDAPVATPLTVRTSEDTAVSFTLGGTDLEGDALTYALVTSPTRGTLSGVPPALTYTPNANVSGNDTFTFRVSDGSAQSAPATVTLEVTPVNDTPTATPQSVTTAEDTARSIVLAGTDPEGDALTFQIIAQPTRGTLTGTPPNVTYTPAANFFGTDSFQFTVRDGSATSAPATVSLTVTAVNDAPSALAQSVTTAQGTPVALTLAGTDPDGDTLSYIIVLAPTRGALTGTAPNMLYTPAPDTRGSDSFTFRVSDGTAQSAPATVSLTVTAVNGAPAAAPQTLTTNEDTPRAIVLSGSDPDGDPLTFTVETQPQHGTLTGTPPNLTYTPAPNYHGPDTFAFTVSDGAARSSPAAINLAVTAVNDPPTAQPIALTTAEDQPVALTLYGGDIDGDALTYTIATQPAHGTLTGTPPNLTYTPAPRYNGPDSFTFRASDGTAQSAPATVSITVTPVNEAPAANPQTLTTTEDAPKSFTLSGSDPDGDALTFIVTTLPRNGTLSGSGTTLTYTPNANFNGADSLAFRASDGALTSVPATVSITVTPVNDAPLAATQSVTTSEGAPVAIRLAGSDIDGDALSFTVVSAPTRGTLTGAPPNLTYTPAPHVNGTDSLAFTVSDGVVTSAPATVSIVVTPLNDPPVATARALTTAEDTPLAITLTGTDPDDDTLAFIIEARPTRGTLTGTPPTVLYTPNPNVSGTDAFTFRVSDGLLTSAPATVSLTVTAVNDAPSANDVSVLAQEDTPTPITLTGLDLDGDPLTFALVSAPARGTLTGTPPNLLYTPLADSVGGDNFRFTVSDGQATSAPAMVSITILAANDAPVALPATYTTSEDTPLSLTLTATDRDGDALSLLIEESPQHGRLTGTPPDLTYTPDAHFNGTDGFTFYAYDGQNISSLARVTVHVTPVNDAPVAQAQGLATAEDTPVTVTLTATDVDADALTFTVVTQPTNGQLTGTPPNLTYAPRANYSGADSFTFRASDGTLASAPATISITVTPVNDGPTASPLSVLTQENVPKALTLVGTDIDGDPLTYTLITPPLHGTLSGAAPNLTYTPTSGYSGLDGFSFFVSDGRITSAPANVSITITAINDPPTATPQSIATLRDVPVNVTLSGSDPDGDPLTFTVMMQPQRGTLSGSAPNITYTPAQGYSGSDQFGFTVSDGVMTSSMAVVSIVVRVDNRAPAANGQAVTTAEDTPRGIILVGTDPDGDALSYRVFNPPSFGTLSGTPPELVYRPLPNFQGTDAFTFVASDGSLTSTPATVSITITPVNDAPVALAQTVMTPEDTPVAIVLSASDVDAQPLAFELLSAPTQGALTGNAPTLTYTPNANFNGADAFTFRASDGVVASAPVTVSIVVTPVNDTPAAQSQTLTTLEDTPIALSLFGSDADADAISFEIATLPTRGTLAGTPPSLVYTPNANFTGTDVFTYRVRDAVTSSAVATITLIVASQNDRPIALPQSVTTLEDTPLALTLTGSDADGDVLDFAITRAPDHGTLVGAPPQLTYQPLGNFTGIDRFEFVANDGLSLSLPATVTIHVTAGNDVPIAEPQDVATPEGVPMQIRLRATDADAQPLTFELVTSPAHGEATLEGEVVTYTPDPEYFGPDTFTFRASDGVAASAPAAVRITVTPINDGPVALSQTLTTAEDVPLAVILTGIDPEGDALAFILLQPPTHGTLFGAPPSLTYVPNANFNGEDSFAFEVSDGTAASSPAVVTLRVTPVNDRPVADARRFTAVEDTPTPILLTAADVDGDALTFAIVTPPTRGALSGDAPNLIYTPAPSFAGEDTFTFTASDGALTSTPATISIVTTPVNDVPIATPQFLTTPEDAPLPIVLTATDADGDAVILRIATPPSQGRLQGTLPNLVYVPNANFNGEDRFTFTASDATTTSTAAAVTVRVTPVNDLPSAEGGRVATDEDTPLAITLRGTDADGDLLTYSIATAPQHGTLTGTPPNLTYVPAANFNGEDSFTFTAADAVATSTSARVTITVNAVNDAPVAQSQSATTNEDEPVAVTLIATDVDGDALRYELVSPPARGVLIGEPPNVTYSPASDFAGTDTFTFRALDASTTSNVATVTVVVASRNDRPVAVGASITTAEDTPIAITLRAEDPDGEPLTFAIVAAPEHGTLTGALPALTYTPAPDFFGVDAFTFTAADAAGTSTPATVIIEVTPVNDAPVANALRVETPEDVPALVTLEGTDADGDPLTFTVVAAPRHGALTGEPPRLTYTPAPDFAGTDRFSYAVSDGRAQSAAAEVTLIVGAVSDAPVADDLNVTTPEDTPVQITLSARDPDDEPLTFTLVAPPMFGELRGAPPALTYAPNANFVGTDTFSYTASDGASDSAPAVVRIQVTPVNDAPVATPRTIATGQGMPVVITLTGTDVDGDALTFALGTPPQHGLVTGAPPTLTYTPRTGYVGSDAFTFTAFDGQVQSAPATININVRFENHAPTATPLTVLVTEDTPVDITLGGADVDGDPLVFAVTSLPSSGTLAGAGARHTYTPAPDFAGTDRFTFSVSDGALSASATVTLDVRGVNDAPTARAQQVTTTDSVAVDFVLGATDPDGDALTFAIITVPSRGTLTGSAPNLNYAPNRGFIGTDGFTFTVSDGVETSVAATVTLVVGPSPTNRSPTATGATLDTVEDRPVAITLAGEDPDGQPLTFTITAPPEHGTLTGTPPNVTYSPTPHFVGTDAFSFTVSDGALTSEPAVVTLRVADGNDAPIAAPQSLSTPAGTPLDITLSASDEESTSLSFRVIDLPTQGALSGAPPAIVYTPAAGFVGADRFTFVANDGELDSAPATITIDVTAVVRENRAPTAHAHDATVKSGGTVRFTLTGTDPDGDALTFAITTPPQHGLIGSDLPVVSYTPTPGFVGTDTFSFTVSDGRATSEVAVVRIVITPADPATGGCGCSTADSGGAPFSGASWLLLVCCLWLLRRRLARIRVR